MAPESQYWTPARIAVWAGVAVLVSVWLGPKFVRQFRPPENRFMDFSQEWLSAKNYWAGTPVYADQTEALLRHTGFVPNRGEAMLPWNGHPPAATALALPFGKLPYRDALLAWNLLTFPLFLVSVALVARELGVRWTVWSVFPAVTLLLLFDPVYQQLAQGQLNFLLVFLITLTWVADRHDRPGWAGIALGIAAGLKLYPAFLFVYFLFTGRWRALATGALAVLTVNGGALVLFGPSEFRTYAEQVIPSLFGYQGSWRNVSLTGFWLRIFDPQPHDKVVPLVVNPTAATALALVSRGLVTGAVAWAAWRARAGAGRDRAFAGAVVGMLLVSPIVWTHYFVLLVLPVGLLWARLPKGALRVALALAAVPLWAPENFFALLAVGPEQARAMVNLRHDPLSPVVNLTALSAFTYALVALFVLAHFIPAGADDPLDPEHGPPERAPGAGSDDELLDQRFSARAAPGPPVESPARGK